jgi:hypothetical protein
MVGHHRRRWPTDASAWLAQAVSNAWGGVRQSGQGGRDRASRWYSAR